jgi:PKHD-type hydroxylase
MSGAEPTTVDKGLGKVVLFPSFMLHRVTPVTKGIRRSLVVWVTGPAFK